MKRVFDLLILIHWYPFLLAKSSSISPASSSYFIFDKDPFQKAHYVNDTFSIGGTFQLKCFDSQCLTNLKLALKNDHKLLIDFWCDSPAILVSKKSDGVKQSSCVLDGIDAVEGEYRFSAVVQAHTAGSFRMIFSAMFLNNPNGNQQWSSEKIVVLNSSINGQQPVRRPILKRKRRQDKTNLDDTNIQTMIREDGGVVSASADHIQTVAASDISNVINPPIQLNAYTGDMNVGHTADLTCNGPNSCPDYPRVDEQGRLVCCFSLPQIPDGTTALSSVVYQNGAQNLNDFQVNVGNGQSFNAANDLSVFLGSTIATSQCNIILPAGTTQSNDAQFRVTWIYDSNSTDLISPPPVTSITDGTLPVNILRVTSTSTFAQQTDQYNEWFVCPPSQDDQITLLRSIALLAGNNINYLRCIFVNNQGIPLKDPTNGQLLVFTSSKSSSVDNPTITNLPDVHTDCIAIQFFPKNEATVDLNSVLLSITIAFQAAPTTNVPSIMPQVSDLQGTSQVQIDITVDVSPINSDNIANTGQTNVQSPSSTVINNSSNDQSMSCSSYQFDVPMSFDISLGEYTSTFDIASRIPQSTMLHSVVVTGSSAVQNPITMLFADSQGKTLSEPFSLDLGDTVENDLQIVISKMILQATALQDASMDSSLHTEIVVCPEGTEPSPSNPSPLVNAAQAYPPSQSFQSPPSISAGSPINCQERTDSTYGTYPPNLLPVTVPTKGLVTSKPSSGADVTPPTPDLDLTIQTLPDYTCFNEISFSNNSFLYDIQISTTDHTNSMDCLSPTRGCSIDFISTKQPKIALLFTTHTCISSLRIPSPSNVQLFSFSMFDENGNQIRLPEAADSRGTLLSSSGADATVQMNPYSCGYSIILQLLDTNDNGPPTRVTIDADGCFRNLSATTTTTTPISPSVPSNGLSTPPSQQTPSSASASTDIQSVVSVSSPVYAPLPASQSDPSLPSSPSLLPILPFEQQSLTSIRTAASPPSSTTIILASPVLLPMPSPFSVFYEIIIIPSPILQPSTLLLSFFQTMLSSPILVAPPSSSVNISFQTIQSPSAVSSTSLTSSSSPPSPPPPPSSSVASMSSTILPTLPSVVLSQQSAAQFSPQVQSPFPPSLQETLAPSILVSRPLAPTLAIQTAPALAVTPPTVPIFQPVPVQVSPQFIVPAPPQLIILQTTAPPSQVSAEPTNTCPQIPLTTHPGVELVIFSDGTNVTSDMDPNGKGCNLASTGTTMTVLLRTGIPATFSSVGVSSSNVNQIEVALFDETSNRPLIQSPQGTVRSPLTLNPSVQNLPSDAAATLAVTFLSTVDGQPPRNVTLLIYACFPTISQMSPVASMTQSTNTFSEQPYFPTNPNVQAYPSYQQNQFPTNVCIDSFKPSQVTSVANIALPPEYYSSNQCVCICQSGVIVPTSSGVIQYYPSAQTTAITSAQRRRKRQTK